jgi:hypothetical protein
LIIENSGGKEAMKESYVVTSHRYQRKPRPIEKLLSRGVGAPTKQGTGENVFVRLPVGVTLAHVLVLTPEQRGQALADAVAAYAPTAR